MKKYIYQEYSGTIRKMPQNYWIATVNNNKLVFDSWDKAPKFNKLYVGLLWWSGKIKKQTPKYI